MESSTFPSTDARASHWRRLLAAAARHLIVVGAKLVTGLRSFWEGNSPHAEQTVYFANHSSHGDFVLLWASLPADLRTVTRPVAGEDYWSRSALRRFIGCEVFNALLIRRQPGAGASAADPVASMGEALQAGDSLIIFPEGTRNTTDQVLLPFKSGLFHLARSYPHVRLVPVWIENLQRVLPKGALLPIPLACSVRFGAPLVLDPDMDKSAFLAAARAALLEVQPPHDRAANGEAAGAPSRLASDNGETP